MMADDLPEAGLRPGRAWLYPAPPTTPEEVETARQQLQGMLKEFPADHFDAEAPNAGRASGAFDIAWPNYLFYSSQPVPGVLPCQEEGSFTRNFGDEFLCVKRPDYYTFVYAGRPMGEWQKDRLPREPDHQYPRNDGGLGLFATPPFGAAVLGKNWSTYACQTVIATTTEGEVQWPYYWSIQSTLREEPAEAVTTGRLRDLPITFERRLTFADNRVEGALTLVAEKDVTLASLVECFPIAPEKTDAISVELCDAAGQKVESGDSAQTIRFVSSVGPGPLITLDQPRPVTVRECRSVDHYGGEHAWRSVVIALPPRLTAAEPTRLRWMLLPQ
jgi:hypothetical protein